MEYKTNGNDTDGKNIDGKNIDGNDTDGKNIDGNDTDGNDTYGKNTDRKNTEALVSELIATGVFVGHDINVIRIISTYCQRRDTQTCSGQWMHEFDAATSNNVVQSSTVDKYERLWVAFKLVDKLSVFSLSGQLLFHVQFCDMKRPKHIKAVGDQLVITQFKTTFVSVLEFTGASDGIIRHVCRFDTMNTERNGQSDCCVSLNWCCRFGGFNFSTFVPDKCNPFVLMSATISEQTKDIIVVFETRFNHHTWFAVFSQGLFAAGSPERQFYIKPIGDPDATQVYFLDHLEKGIIINRQRPELWCFDYYGSKCVSVENDIKSWLSDIHLSISDIASIVTSPVGDIYIQGLRSEGIFVNPGLLKSHVYQKQDLRVPGGPGVGGNGPVGPGDRVETSIFLKPRKFDTNENISAAGNAELIITSENLLLSRQHDRFNVYY